MAKRSRKLSTRRPRRSNSSSRKTMKRTKRQPSKKRTLKKHSSKKRKSRTKSVRKRKKTKKVMKGGVKDSIEVNEFIKYFNNSTATRTITKIIMGEIPLNIKMKMAVEIQKLPESTSKIRQAAKVSSESRGLVQYLIFLTDKKKIIGVLLSSNIGKIIVKADKNKTLKKETIETFIKDNYINPGFQVTNVLQRAEPAAPLGHFATAEKSAAATAAAAEEEPLYRPIYAQPAQPDQPDQLSINYKYSEFISDVSKLTLLDGENNGNGTTVEIVIDRDTGTKSIPKFTDYMPTTTSISSFDTLQNMFNYYKEQTFIYPIGADRSQAVLLGDLKE